MLQLPSEVFLGWQSCKNLVKKSKKKKNFLKILHNMKHIDRDVILLVLSCVIIIGWAIFHFGWLHVLLTIIIFTHRMALPLCSFLVWWFTVYYVVLLSHPVMTNGVDREIN